MKKKKELRREAEIEQFEMMTYKQTSKEGEVEPFRRVVQKVSEIRGIGRRTYINSRMMCCIWEQVRGEETGGPCASRPTIWPVFCLPSPFSLLLASRCFLYI